MDDEKSIRESLGKVLRTEGYEVVLGEDGEEAIQKLIQEPIDILVLDIGLPVKDGWAALRWLAQVNPLFPVILITGRWKQAELAEAAGVDVLMEKPLNVPNVAPDTSMSCSRNSRKSAAGNALSEACLAISGSSANRCSNASTTPVSIRRAAPFQRSLNMKKVILVVDDDPQIRESLGKLLSCRGLPSGIGGRWAAEHRNI